MIRELHIKGLNGSNKELNFSFNDDLNLFTGLNGCGKTTILKLLWFANSGKITDYLSEFVFDQLTIKSDKYKMSITNTKKECKVDLTLISDKKNKDKTNTQEILITNY